MECPDSEIWNGRNAWLEQVIDQSQHPLASYMLSEQACALTMDVQLAFCAGAWVCVIVMAAAVIEAQLREVEVGSEDRLVDLIDQVSADSRLHALCKRRNATMHLTVDVPVITADQRWPDQALLEQEARDAIELMFETLHMSPGV